MSTTTTIKVPAVLRDRISARAARDSISQAAVVADALDALDRRDFWRSIGDGYQRLAENTDEYQEYLDERDSWIDAPLTDSGR
ncbi:MAG: hypothetical protein GEU79_09500 [Acidimicrobiia bacterium]|nr:hypothetical protein [Acidimicrobiia bacterium]